MMKRIYFLCTGNSCRSQMAQGFAKKYLSSNWQVESAGVEAHGLNLQAVKVMAEKGIDISANWSKTINPDSLRDSDMVVTLCDDARDRCPVLPPHITHLHWPLPDPAQIFDSEDRMMKTFRSVRDAIEVRVRSLAVRLG